MNWIYLLKYSRQTRISASYGTMLKNASPVPERNILKRNSNLSTQQDEPVIPNVLEFGDLITHRTLVPSLLPVYSVEMTDR